MSFKQRIVSTYAGIPMISFLKSFFKSRIKIVSKPHWKEISYENKIEVLAPVIFSAFKETLRSGSQISIINSYYHTRIKNPDNFPFILKPNEEREVLSIIMAALLHAMLKVYMNSVFYHYYRSFYQQLFVNPKIKNNQTFSDLDTLIDCNAVISILDLTRLEGMPAIMFENIGMDGFLTDTVVDINEYAPKIFYMTESIATTFQRSYINNFIDSFVNTYLFRFRKLDSKVPLMVLYLVFAIHFNKRFQKTFYKENGKYCLYNKHSFTFEYNVALKMYKAFMVDKKEFRLDYKSIIMSLKNNGGDVLDNFHNVLKMHIFEFVDKCTALQILVSDTNVAINPVIDKTSNDNVVSIKERLSKKLTVNEYSKIAEAFKASFN